VSEILQMFTLYCFISALLPVSTVLLINSVQYVYEARCVVDITPGDDHMTADLLMNVATCWTSESMHWKSLRHLVKLLPWRNVNC